MIEAINFQPQNKSAHEHVSAMHQWWLSCTMLRYFTPPCLISFLIWFLINSGINLAQYWPKTFGSMHKTCGLEIDCIFIKLLAAHVEDNVWVWFSVVSGVYLGEFRFRDGALWWSTVLETRTVLLKAQAVIIQSWALIYRLLLCMWACVRHTHLVIDPILTQVAVDS